MHSTTLTDGDSLRRLQPAWEELQQGAHGSIFQSPEWLNAWWSTYGGQFNLHVRALWNGGQLVGLVPCYSHRTRFITYARAMGEHAVFGAYAPLLHPEFLGEGTDDAAGFLAGLLHQGRCSFIDFHHVPSPSPFFQRLRPQLHEHGCSMVSHERSLPRLLVELPADWETYVRSLSSHERHFARALVRMEAQESPPIRIRVRRDPAALDDLIRLHTRVWTERGQRGYFKGRKGFETFFRTLLPGLLASGKAAFYTVEAGGTTIATTVAFFTPGESCAYLSGRDSSHPARKHSPGKALLTAIIRDSIAAGLPACDLMEGLTEYKFRVGGGLSWFSRETIFPRGVRGLLGRSFLAMLTVRSLRDPRRMLQRRWAEQRYGGA